MHTLKILMSLTALGFHFDRLCKKYENEPHTGELLVTLMQRCTKMYNTLEHLSVVFKLSRKKLVINATKSKSPKQHLDDRILSAIQGFLTEHTLHPIQFIFKREDMLE